MKITILMLLFTFSLSSIASTKISLLCSNKEPFFSNTNYGPSFNLFGQAVIVDIVGSKAKLTWIKDSFGKMIEGEFKVLQARSQSVENAVNVEVLEQVYIVETYPSQMINEKTYTMDILEEDSFSGGELKITIKDNKDRNTITGYGSWKFEKANMSEKFDFCTTKIAN